MKGHLIAYTAMGTTIAVMTAMLLQKKTSSETQLAPITPPSSAKRLTAKNDKKESPRKSTLPKAEKKTKEKNTRRLKAAAIPEKESNSKAKLGDIADLIDRQGASEQMKKWSERMNRKRYDALLTKLGLSDADKEAFYQLLFETEQAKQQRMADMFRNGNPGEMDPQEFKELTSDDNSALKDLLGDNFSTFERYKKTLRERRELSKFEIGLDEEQKLNEDQQEQLVDLMHKRNKAAFKRKGEKVEDSDLLDEAGGFLDDDQTDELAKHFKRNKARPFSFESFGDGGGQVIFGGDGGGSIGNMQILTTESEE